jgi:DNA uptake protein ComE-like DNA-binding protein
MNSTEAETITRKFIKQKHHRLELISFRTIYREGEDWALEGIVEYKRFVFAVTTKKFVAKVNINTANVESYKFLPQQKK